MGAWSRALHSLKLEPVFGVKVFDASRTCADVHPHGPVAKDSACCCMVCHQTGRESHPDLKETPEQAEIRGAYNPHDEYHKPEPEPSTDATPTVYEAVPELKTRKQRRREVFGKATDPDELRRIIDGGGGRMMGK